MESVKDRTKTTQHIIDFLASIDIKVVDQKLPTDTFLPGIDIQKGTILVDFEQLKYPGDLLHEAGHIAVTEPKLRHLIGTPDMDKEWPSDGDEIATILWSYAASVHLNLDLNIVFHPDGYKGQSDWLQNSFNDKNYIGLPLLEWMSLCNAPDFPLMKRWLRK